VEFTSDAADPGLIKIVELKKDAGGKLDLTEAPVIITGDGQSRQLKTIKCLKHVLKN